MSEPIRSVAVIGAGIMGAGIAAHCANAGLRTHLLDIVPEGAADRDVLARQAIERLARARPEAFAEPAAADRVAPGNIEDDLAVAGACDLVIEAVVEDLAIKQALYRRLAEVRGPHTIIASNTSTLSLAELTDGLRDEVVQNFVVTHFFNPPRHMRLVELVHGPASAEAGARARDFCDEVLGKRVVVCRDRPGFIANRLGTFWMTTAVRLAVERGLAPEDADAALGKPFGVPPTGVFGLLDLVGIDLMARAVETLRSALPPEDAFQTASQEVTLFADMAAAGRHGRKTKAGFFRRSRTEDGGDLRETFDWTAGAYRPTRRPEPSAAMVTEPGAEGALAAYAWDVMARTLAYACALVPDVSDSPTEIDAAMTLGYGWREGPFTLLDRLGPARIAERLTAQGEALPSYLAALAEAGRTYAANMELRDGGGRVPVPVPPGVMHARSLPVLRQNESATVRDMGDGVALFEFRTKMNTFDAALLELLRETVEMPPEGVRALVIGNDGANFSAGADLKAALAQADSGDWEALADSVRRGQSAFLSMKYGGLPVVGACTGLTLGGGCEILMHCHAVQAHLETRIGLVETNVGIIPAWGGTTQMLLRQTEAAGDLIRGAVWAFEIIAPATLAAAAPVGQTAGYLPVDMGLTMNRERLLADAKACALRLAEEGAARREPVVLRLETGPLRDALGDALKAFAVANPDAPYAVDIARELAWVLGGGDASGTVELREDDLHGLERAAFLRLFGDARTHARMRHTLETGKPLRN